MADSGRSAHPEEFCNPALAHRGRSTTPIPNSGYRGAFIVVRKRTYYERHG